MCKELSFFYCDGVSFYGFSRFKRANYGSSALGLSKCFSNDLSIGLSYDGLRGRSFSIEKSCRLSKLPFSYVFMLSYFTVYYVSPNPSEWGSEFFSLYY
jgi:hypothetical protein